MQALLIPSRPAAAQAPPADTSAPRSPIATSHKNTDPSKVSAWRHPLDPLEPAEIAAAVAAIRKERQLADSVRFVTVTLKEPSKEIVLDRGPAVNSLREAFVILLDKATGRGYEAEVDLRAGTVRRYEALPEGVQPPIMLEEFAECEEAARRSPVFRAAMKKRGIEDMSLVMIDAWSAGHYGNEPPEDKGKRLVRASAGSAPSPTTTTTPGPSRTSSRSWT